MTLANVNDTTLFYEPVEEASGPPAPAEFLAMLADPPQSDEELSVFKKRMMPMYLNKTDASDNASILDDTIFSAAAMRRGLEVLSSWSAVDRTSSIAAPTLLSVGKHDTFTSPSQTYRMARQLPHAELVEFDESGYMPWLDEPERFFPVVSDWLIEQKL